MKTVLRKSTMRDILSDLSQANNSYTSVYPGDSPEPQPIHTLYGGAHLFKADTARKIGELSLKHLKQYAPTPEVLARALQLKGDAKFLHTLYSRVEGRLRTCAV